MVTQFTNEPEGLVSLSFTPEAQGIGKFIVVNDAEERSVYVDLSTSPPTIFGPEHRRFLESETVMEATA